MALGLRKSNWRKMLLALPCNSPTRNGALFHDAVMSSGSKVHKERMLAAPILKFGKSGLIGG